MSRRRVVAGASRVFLGRVVLCCVVDVLAAAVGRGGAVIFGVMRRWDAVVITHVDRDEMVFVPTDGLLAPLTPTPGFLSSPPLDPGLCLSVLVV